MSRILLSLPTRTLAGVSLGAALCAAALAAETGEETFAVGEVALEAGNYDKAVRDFTAALDAGYDDPEVHYKLGVAHFRLREFDQAEQAFERLAQSRRWAPVAYYNLGAVALAREDKAAAEAWYQQAYQNTPNEQLREKTAEQIRALGAEPRDKRGAFTAAVYVGYDDNLLVSGLDDELVNVDSADDEFYDFALGGALRLLGSARNGLRLVGNVQHRDYEDVNEFDQGAGVVGLVYDRIIGQWRTETGLQGEVIYLDDDELQRAGVLYVQGTRKLGERPSLRLRYEGNAIDGNDDADFLDTDGFDFLDGEQHEATAELVFQWDQLALSAGYRFEFNDRDDRERSVAFSGAECAADLPVIGPVFCTEVTNTVTEFSSFSARRHIGFVKGVWAPREDLRFTAHTQYQDSRYRDKNTLEINGAQVSAERRKEQQVRGGLSGEWRFQKNWMLTGDYTYTDNDSNFEDFRYDRNLVRMGVGFVFD